MKKINICILSLVILWLFPQHVTAEAGKSELKLDAAITEWVLSDEENRLYAISAAGKSLMVINTETLSVIQTLPLESTPSNIMLEDGILYISAYYDKKIMAYDTKEQKIIKTMSTTMTPRHIVKEGDSLLYISNEITNPIYKYNLKTDTDEIFINQGHSNVSMAVNTKDHILYVGESASSGCSLTYYNSLTGERIAESTYKDGYGFSFAKEGILFDGEYVYYAMRNFDKKNPDVFEGDYGGTDAGGSNNDVILAVTDQLVFTTQGVYEKDTHIKIGTYQKGASISLAAATEDEVYLYDEKTQTIKKAAGQKITKENIISLIAGQASLQIQRKWGAKQILSACRTVDMYSDLTDWVVEEKSNRIYALSSEAKTIFFLNGTTLDIEHSITFKSIPRQMLLEDGKLYVVFRDLKQIRVLSAQDGRELEVIYTENHPSSIVKDESAIYYISELWNEGVYRHSLQDGSELEIMDRFNRAVMEINTKDQVLYVGDYGNGWSELYYYSTKDYSQIGEAKTFHYAGKKIIFDGEKVHYAGYRLDAANPSKVEGQYGDEEEALLVKNGLVYTDYAVYEQDTFEEVDYYDDMADLFEVAGNGQMLYYYKEDQEIVMMDESCIAYVMYVTDPDSYEWDDMIMVENQALLPKPADPVKKGFIFDGWCKDEECRIPWNFEKDLVDEFEILYAKWIKEPETVLIESASYKEDNTVTIWWKKSANQTGYEVYRASAENGTYELVGKTTEQSFTDASLANGQTWYYKVRAYNEGTTAVSYGAFSKVQKIRTRTNPVSKLTAKRYTHNSIQLSFSLVKGADSYEIYRAQSKEGPYEKIEDTKKTSYIDQGLSLNTDYYYKVRAYFVENGTSIYSEFSQVQSQKLVMAAPGALKSESAEFNAVRLSWSAVEGAESYQLYRSDAKNGKYTYVKSTSKTACKDTGLDPNKTYYYKVRAVKWQGEKKVYSNFTSAVAAKPVLAAVEVISVKASAYNKVELTWKKSRGCTSYEVYRSTSKNGKYKLVGNPAADYFTDTTVKTGVTYYYKIRARRGSENTVYSAYTPVFTAKTKLSVPTGLKVKKNGKSAAQVSFKSVKGATGYEISRATAKNGTYKKITKTKTKSDKDTSLKKGKTYYYKVRAYRLVDGKKVYSSYSKAVSYKVK